MTDDSGPPLAAVSRRDPWTVRVAGFSARHRWPVALLWLASTLGLFGASLAVGGTDAVEAVSNERRARYEAGEAVVLFNASGTEAPSQDLLFVVSGPVGAAREPDFGVAVADIVGRLTALRSTVDGIEGPVVDRLIDPLTAPPEAGLVSADGSAVRIVARVPGDGDVLEERLAPAPALIEELRAAHPIVRIDVLNSTLANDEISELVNSDLDESLRLTIPLTFAILLIAFGAVVAAAVPLVLAATALLAAFGILGLYSRLVDPVSPYANQLVVLIGLAVAVDYSLFMITRFRSERRAGRERLAAIHVSSSTAGRAVFFSGVAVMISIAGLFMLDDPLFRSMALGTIAVVLISVVGSLTFLPAVLALLGDRVNRLRLPVLGRDREEAGGLWAALVRRVMRRPVFWAAVSGLALLALATPVFRLHLGQGDFSSFPDRLEAVRAIQVLDEKWPEGSTLDLDIVVTRADAAPTQAAIEELNRRVLDLDGVSPPARTARSVDGEVARVSYLMSGSRNDEANRAVVRELRARVVPEVFGGLPGVRALVAGDAAYTLDVVMFYATGMPVVMAFVLGLSFVLLLIAFRSIVIPIKAILLNLLSTGASYGLLVLVFQEGWFADVLGFKTGVIESFVPVFIFTVLFGLSMDYHVFILTRIKEARDRGVASNEAVAQGIAITSGTITSAAAIMVVVFSVFVTLELQIIKQLGFGLAVAVFLDATVVRCVLLPATMRLLGEWNWWLPRWLSWLPRVSIEAEPEPGAPPAALAPRPSR